MRVNNDKTINTFVLTFSDEYLYSTDQPNFKENQMINIEFLENIRLHNQHKRDVSWSVKDVESLTTIGNNDKYTQVSSVSIPYFLCP